MPDSAVNSLPRSIEEAHVDALMDALKAVQWNSDYMQDGKPRRTAQLAIALVRAGVRVPGALDTPSWNVIASLCTMAEPSTMIGLELLNDPKNRTAQGLRLAFEEGMRFAGSQLLSAAPEAA